MIHLTPLGSIFGRLTVIEAERSSRLRCRCTCGREIQTRSHELVNGSRKSCGCFARQRLGNHNRTHGLSRTPEYRAWLHLRRRCFAPSDIDYRYYGGRGISVHPPWRVDFTAFLAHVGPRPPPGHTIDRIDNEKDYEPGNVRWADSQTQARNRRDRHLIEFRGRTATLIEWATETGLDLKMLSLRIGRYGWPIERALTEPARAWGPGHPRP